MDERILVTELNRFRKLADTLDSVPSKLHSEGIGVSKD